MPPKSIYKAFKPPRPVTAASSSSKSTETASKSKQSTSKTKSKGKAPIELSSSDASPSDGDDAGGKGAGNMSDASDPFAITPPAKSADEEPSIPSKLLSRVAHEHFQHDDTRITKEAMNVLAKYIEIFAREAICRASAERNEAAKSDPSVDADFLEVEDLEKLTPQLMLDF